MKQLKALLLAIALFGAALTADAATRTAYDSAQIATSLSAVTVTGAGNEFGIGDGYLAAYTWQTTFTGTPTSITANLEGSIDGTTWATLDSSTSTTAEMRHVVNKPVKFLRCNISAYVVNGSTATCTLHVLRGVK